MGTDSYYFPNIRSFLIFVSTDKDELVMNPLL